MRIEKDSMGTMEVREDALYGASTQRAINNFPISGHRMPERLIFALAHVKWVSAVVNERLGILSKSKSSLIRQVCEEVLEGTHALEFPVDIFQTGSGTSTNMNMNEVIAHRGNQIGGEALKLEERLHPNDDVNQGQSSNDVMPTALHVSVVLNLRDNLMPALGLLAKALDEKSESFKDVIKTGRTHLMDATPVTLGQEFSGYASQIKKAIGRTEKAIESMLCLAIGGTAVGTGINTHSGFSEGVCACLGERLGVSFRPAENHFEAQAARDDSVEVAGQLSAIAASLVKIGNDIRLMNSGPRCGLNEIKLPETQPGSSIMPGKVNPVMSEMLIQVCFYANAMNDCVRRCGQEGYFELNTTIPLIAYSLHESIDCLSNGIRVFAERCVQGIEANEEICREYVEQSLMLATALAPKLGYNKTAEIAHRALEEQRSLKDVLREEDILSVEEMDELLNPRRMLKSD